MDDLATAFIHDHDFLGSRHDANARRTLWVVALTAVMMVAEIVAGLITGSMALLADGIHMATHAGALGVAALAYRYAKQHRHDPGFSFGTGKVGDLTGFASALVLGIFAIGIAVESILRLLQPVSVAFGDAALVAVVGLVVNIVSALLLMGGHHHHDHDHQHEHDPHHHHGHDNNLRSAYVHVLADALTSVLAIAALLAGRYLGLGWMDPAMGIVGSIVIARWSWSLMRDTAAVLLDRNNEALAQQIREAVESPGDARVVDLHVWRIGPEAHAAIIETIGGAAVGDRVRHLAALRHVTTASAS